MTLQGRCCDRDAVNTLPVLARLADLAENLDVRVLSSSAASGPLVRLH